MLGHFDYEVALEILGQSQQSLVQARYDEYNKKNQIRSFWNFYVAVWPL